MLAPPLVVGDLLGKSCDLAAVAVYHQGHRRVYRPSSYDPIPLDRLAYGVMMNGRYNSSAETRVAVRVPEDEKSWYGVSGVISVDGMMIPIIIVIVMSLCST